MPTVTHVLEYWHQAIRLLAMEGRVNDEDYLARGLPGGTTGIAALSGRGVSAGTWIKCVLHVDAVLRAADERDLQTTTVLAIPAEMQKMPGGVLLRPPSDPMLPAIPRNVLLAEGEDKESLVLGSVASADEWVSMHGSSAEEARRVGEWGAWWLASMSLLTETAGLLSPHDALEMLEKDLSTAQSMAAGTRYVMRVDVVRRLDVPPEMKSVAAVIDKARMIDSSLLPPAFRAMVEGSATKTHMRPEGIIKIASRHFGIMETFTPDGGRSAQVLDFMQRRAVLAHASGSPLTAVTGPPGTGKTTALSGVVADAIVGPLVLDKTASPAPSFVIATAPTNQAVKNIIGAFSTSAESPLQGEMPNIAGRWLDFTSSYGFFYASATERNKLKSLYNGKAGDTDSDAFMVVSRYCANVEAQDGIKFDTQFFGACHRMAEYYSARGVTKNIVLAARRYAAIAEANLHMRLPHITTYADVKPAMEAVAQRLRNIVIQNADLQRAVHKTFWNALTSGCSLQEVNAFSDAMVKAIKAGGRGTQRASHATEEVEKLAFQLGLLPSHDSPAWADEVEKIFQSVEAHLDEGLRAWALHLSARYWEARWLISRVDRIDAGPRFAKRLADIARDHGLAAAVRTDMEDLLYLAPCIVATPHTMPTIFGVRDRENDLVGIADTIIVDEAGQGQPELVTQAMLFAKRGIVLGDIHQLEPVYKITPEQDANLVRAVARSAGTAVDIPAALRVSSGTVMQMALNGANSPEILLDRHYRCRPEIIGWSNKHCYGGRLKPMRSAAASHDPDDPLPVLGYAAVAGTADRSDKRGSIRNATEAAKLVDWLFSNREIIRQRYGKPLHECVGILTPYARQKHEIRRGLLRRFGDEPEFVIGAMKMGSVHQLQGAQRELVLFSAATEAPAPGQRSFLDQSLNLLNTARSRARESFILFAAPSMISRSDDLPFGTFMADLKEHGKQIKLDRPMVGDRPSGETPSAA